MKIGSRSIRFKNTNGQALVEYVLIIALISVVIIAVVKILGGHVMDSLTKTSCSVSGTTYVPGEKSAQGKCVDKGKDDKDNEDDENEWNIEDAF